MACSRRIQQCFINRIRILPKFMQHGSGFRMMSSRSTRIWSSSEETVIDVEADAASSTSSRKVRVVDERKITQAAPDWLPLVPGSSYWIPSEDEKDKPKLNLSDEKLTACFAPCGWPVLSEDDDHRSRVYPALMVESAMGEGSAAVVGSVMVEVLTPEAEPMDVFKRLYKGCKTGPKAQKPSTKVEDKKQQSKPMPSKGREVPSKFSGTVTTKKYEVQRRRFSIKTPAMNVHAKLQSNKRLDKASASVRLAKSKLQSARYWLSLIDVAEKAENHLVSMGLFHLAISCGAEPVADIRKALGAYKTKHKLNDVNLFTGSFCTSNGDKESVAATMPSDSQHAAVPPSDDTNASEAVYDAAEFTPHEENYIAKVETVKNLYEEEYSQIAVGEVSKPKDLAEENGSSEVIDNGDAGDDVSSKVNQGICEENKKNTPRLGDDVSSKDICAENKKNAPRPYSEVRRTPKRACAIQAAMRIEESAKKYSRKKPAEMATPEVHKMDVDELMKQVVSCMMTDSSNDRGPSSTGKQSAKKSAKNTGKPTTQEDKNQQLEDDKSKASGKENDHGPCENKIESALQTPVRKEQKKASNITTPGTGEVRRSARLRSTPNKGAFY